MNRNWEVRLANYVDVVQRTFTQQPAAKSHILKENLEADNLTNGHFLVQGTPPENAGALCNRFPTAQLSPTASLSEGRGEIAG
jgi:hypothetical protein